MARTLCPEELRIVSRVQLDAVSYLAVALHQNFVQMDEETRLSAMTEFFMLQRRPGESINSLLARYEIVRDREGRKLTSK